MFLHLSITYWFVDFGIQFPSDRSDDPVLSKCVCVCECVCVKHLNRCKTSIRFAYFVCISVGSLHFRLVHLFGYAREFTSISFQQGFMQGNSLLFHFSRETQHFTGTVSNEATSEMGYPVWPTGRTCSVFSPQWHRAKPRTLHRTSISVRTES